MAKIVKMTKMVKITKSVETMEQLNYVIESKLLPVLEELIDLGLSCVVSAASINLKDARNAGSIYYAVDETDPDAIDALAMASLALVLDSSFEAIIKYAKASFDVDFDYRIKNSKV